MEDKKSFKEQLVEKAKELAERPEVKNTFKEVADLRKKWKKTYSEEESLFDKELEDKFEGYLAKVEKAQKELFASAKEAKEEIIKKVNDLQNSKQFKDASKKMDELFEEFKAIGNTKNKEEDDELWARFKEAKDAFYNKKNEYYAKLKEGFEKNKLAKEDLIARAKEVLDLENIKEAGQKMEDLMNEWKKTGNAGKAINDDLWKAFSDTRKAYFKKKNEYYAHMKEEYGKRAEAKQELIAKAKKYLANSTFTKEEVAEVKAIRNEWKAIGNAGKDNEAKLWQEFQAIMDKYFDNMKYYG